MDTLDLKIKIIEILIEADRNERVCFTRSFITKPTQDIKEIKKVLEELKSIGMVTVEYCVNDDGQLSGRGYILTDRATQWSIREWLQELKNIASPHDGKEQGS